MHHRCQLDLGFNISISVRETEERQGIEKHNLRHAFHVGFLWSPSAFRQHEGRRRGEGEKAAKEGIRSSFDCFSPSFFGYSSTPLHHGIHRVTSEPVTWHCTGVTGMKTGTKPTLGVLPVSPSRSQWWSGLQLKDCIYRRRATCQLFRRSFILSFFIPKANLTHPLNLYDLPLWGEVVGSKTHPHSSAFISPRGHLSSFYFQGSRGGELLQHHCSKGGNYKSLRKPQN